MLFCVPAIAWGSTGEENGEFEPQKSKGIELPAWGPGEMQGTFDIRIWPDDMVLWLEREHLRRRSNDPDLPAEERAELKQVLARQLAWNRRWVNE